MPWLVSLGFGIGIDIGFFALSILIPIPTSKFFV